MISCSTRPTDECFAEQRNKPSRSRAGMSAPSPALVAGSPVRLAAAGMGPWAQHRL